MTDDGEHYDGKAPADPPPFSRERFDADVERFLRRQRITPRSGSFNVTKVQRDTMRRVFGQTPQEILGLTDAEYADLLRQHYESWLHAALYLRAMPAEWIDEDLAELDVRQCDDDGCSCWHPYVPPRAFYWLRRPIVRYDPGSPPAC